MKRLALALFVACGNEAAHDASAVVDSAAAVTVDAQVEDARVVRSAWADLVREEKWVAAAGAIDALPDTEKNKPETKLARALVAVEQPNSTDEAKTAVTMTDGLEGALPALAPEIARTRAKAQAIVGPFADAGEWFEKHALGLADQLAAARAFMKAKLPTRANAACARVLANDHRTRAQETDARSVRLHTGEGADAIADARWLLAHGDLKEAKDAELVLTKDDPKHPLTQAELVSRAEALADDGNLDEALRALDRAISAQVGKQTPVELRRVRADLMMRARTRYDAAAGIFKQLAGEAGNAHAASDLLWSARALSRADKDDDAIERYADVIARFPKSAEAGSARFYSGRLELLHARWDKAITRLDEFVTKNEGSPDHDEGLRLRAIARYEEALGTKADQPKADVKKVRALLEQRAGSEREAGARARMTNLAAVIADKDGDRTHAIARFTDAAQTLPLSWAALVARARLVQLGAPVPPAMPAAAASPASPLVVTLPEAVATLDRIGFDSLAEEALHAREAEVTGAAPSRSVEALCTAYGKVDRARRRMQLSSQASPSYLQAAPSDATRWAWECAYPSPYTTTIRDAEIRETLPTGLLYAVMRQESSFDEGALSPARAIGLMQLIPETATSVSHEMGLRLDDARELHDPVRAITLGARHLHDLLIKTKGSVPLAVAAYNAGAESVLRWAQRMHAMELDAFVESIPFLETRGYVIHVMESFARYGYLAHGEEGVPKLDLPLP